MFLKCAPGFILLTLIWQPPNYEWWCPTNKSITILPIVCHKLSNFAIWASYQQHKLAGCPSGTGNAGNVFPPSRVSDPDLHHATCVTHGPWCMSGSLTSGFLWSQWQGKPYRHSRRMRNPQFYVSGKRSMLTASIWGLFLLKEII